MSVERAQRVGADLVALLEQLDRFEEALLAIRDYDSFRGGPIAPRSTPTEDALRRIAGEALRS